MSDAISEPLTLGDQVFVVVTGLLGASALAFAGLALYAFAAGSLTDVALTGGLTFVSVLMGAAKALLPQAGRFDERHPNFVRVLLDMGWKSVTNLLTRR